MKWLVVVVMLLTLFSVVGAEGNVVLVSEAYQLQDTTGDVSCGNDFLCSDEEFGSSVSFFSELRDGNTDTGVLMSNVSGSSLQDKAMKLIYDLPLGLLSGANYTLRMYVDELGVNTTEIYVVPYETLTTPFTDFTSVYSLDDGGERWYDLDVTELVKASYNETGRVRLRLFVDNRGFINILEIGEDDFECGGFNCNTIQWNDEWQVNDGNTCEVTSSGGPEGSFHFLFSGPGLLQSACDAYRSVDLSGVEFGASVSFSLQADSLEGGEFCNVYYGVGDSYTLLLNITNGQDDLPYESYEFDVSQYGWSDDSRIRVSTNAGQSNDECYIDSILFEGVGGDGDSVSEAFLVDPAIKEFEILDNGVTTTASMNDTIEHRWKVIGGFDFYVSDVFCSVFEVDQDVLMATNVSSIWSNESKTIIARWEVDSLQYEELKNYRISCSANINIAGVPIQIDDFSQYVYVSAEKSILDLLNEVWARVLDLLGLVESIDEGGIAEVSVFAGQHFTGEVTQVVARVSNDGAPINDTTCLATMYYPNMSTVLDGVSMVHTGDGLYQYNITVPETRGTYLIDTRCNGGNLTALTNNTVFGSASWSVVDGVRMESIT